MLGITATTARREVEVLGQPDLRQDMARALATHFAMAQRGGWPARFARWRSMPWLILQKLGAHVWAPAKLFFGNSMRVLTGETTSRAILAFGYTEVALTALMLRHVTAGMTVIDVGAHFGYESILASRLVGPGGHVLSFEPQPVVHSILASNVLACRNVRTFNVAAGSVAGKAQVRDMGLVMSAFASIHAEIDGPAIDVDVVTLDDIVPAALRPVGLIKCDAEGAEIDILQGAVNILRADRPVLILEAPMPGEAARLSRIDEFVQFLSPLGYRLVTFDYDGELKLDVATCGHGNVAFMHEWRIVGC